MVDNEDTKRGHIRGQKRCRSFYDQNRRAENEKEEFCLKGMGSHIEIEVAHSALSIEIEQSDTSDSWVTAADSEAIEE